MKNKYTKDFKEMAVELSYNTDKSLGNLSKELGIKNSQLLSKWRCEMSSNKLDRPSESPEMKDLRKRLEKLEVENQILKKALAICNRM